MLRIALSYTLAEIPFFVQWIDENGKFTPKLFLQIISSEMMRQEGNWVRGDFDGWIEQVPVRWRFRREDDVWSDWVEDELSGILSRTSFDSTWTFAKGLWEAYLNGGDASGVIAALAAKKADSDVWVEKGEKTMRNWKKKRKAKQLRTIRKIEALGPKRIPSKGPIRFGFNNWTMMLFGRYLRCRKGDARIEVRVKNFEDVKSLLA